MDVRFPQEEYSTGLCEFHDIEPRGNLVTHVRLKVTMDNILGAQVVERFAIDMIGVRERREKENGGEREREEEGAEYEKEKVCEKSCV